MDINVIKSYLVEVGFSIDKGEYDKFRGTINSITEVVTKHTNSMAKSFIEAGAAIISAYTAVGSAALTLMDKVATADLGYQLYAMRMYMSVDAAKKLKIATDALGHSLDEIAWNTELRGRFKELVEIQRIMQSGLGGDYESTMKGIRDVKQEWVKFKVEMQYLSMGLASSIFKAFGGEGIFDKLKQWNDYIIHNLPEIRAKIEQYLIPILKDAWEILKNLYKIGKDLFNVFADFVGWLGGDDQIRKTDSSLEKLALTMEKLSKFIKWCSDGMKEFEKDLVIIAGYLAGSRLGMAIGAIVGGFLGNPVAGAAIGSMIGGLVGLGTGISVAATMPSATPEIPYAPEKISERAATHAKKRITSEEFGDKIKSLRTKIFDELAEAAEKKYNLPSGILSAIGQKESGKDISAGYSKLGSTAYGSMQITKDTGDFLKINRFDYKENIEGAAKYLRYQLDYSHGNLPRAIMGYGFGAGGIDENIKKATEYYRDVDKLWRREMSSGRNASRGDTNLTVNVFGAKANDPDDFGRKAGEAARKTIGKANVESSHPWSSIPYTVPAS